jgi:hypothetical protein
VPPASAGFLLGFLSDPEVGSSMVLWNVKLPSNYELQIQCERLRSNTYPCKGLFLSIFHTILLSSWNKKWISGNIHSFSIFHLPPMKINKCTPLWVIFCPYFPMAWTGFLSSSPLLFSHDHLPITCLYSQFNPEEGDSKFLRNISIRPQNYMMSEPRRPQSLP